MWRTDGYVSPVLLSKLLSILSVEVKPFAICRVNHGWRLRLPGPTGIMLHFVLEGDGTMVAPSGEKFALKPYSLSVVPKGVAHSLEPVGKINEELRIDSSPTGEQVCQICAGPEKDCGLVLACGLVKVNFGDSLGLFDHLRDILAVDFSDSPQVKDVFPRIMAEQKQSDPGSDTMTAALMTECLVHLLRQMTDTNHGQLPWLLALADSRLGRAFDEILEDPTANHSVESLAVTASMSRSAFAEKFTSTFGHSPMHFVHQLRMLRAAKLLVEGRYSIDEIAHRINYSSRSHFSEAFKKEFGKSPTAYRS
mgnify:CR=1 FL=1